MASALMTVLATAKNRHKAQALVITKMEIHLIHKSVIVGRIYPNIASNKTGELKGLIVPNEEYHKIRAFINKYSEIFNAPKSKGMIDKILDNLLKKKYGRLKNSYSQIGISIDGEMVTNNKSKIDIYDNLVKSGLGNPIINIEAWNLCLGELGSEIDIFRIEYKYPSTTRHTIEIKSRNQIVLEY